MQPIILFPPNHEQSTPSFHIEGHLAHDFIAFLVDHNVELWQSPKALDKIGGDGKRLVEIEVQSETPVPYLEKLLAIFTAEHSAPL